MAWFTCTEPSTELWQTQPTIFHYHVLSHFDKAHWTGGNQSTVSLGLRSQEAFQPWGKLRASLWHTHAFLRRSETWKACAFWIEIKVQQIFIRIFKIKDIKPRCRGREESNKGTPRSRAEAHASPWGRAGDEGMVIIPLLQILQSLKCSRAD